MRLACWTGRTLKQGQKVWRPWKTRPGMAESDVRHMVGMQQEDALERPLYSDVAPHRDARPVFRELDQSLRARTVLNAWTAVSPIAPGASFEVIISGKCLDGSSAAGRAVVALDEDGAAVGVTRLSAPTEKRGLAEARFSLRAPEKPGVYAWQMAIEADPSHAGAVKTLFFSVAPEARRPVSLRVMDAAKGSPLVDVAAYFYAEGVAGAPTVAECADDGVIRAFIAEGTPYVVRVECARYHEASLKVPAGYEPFESEVGMDSTVCDPVRLSRRGFDQF